MEATDNEMNIIEASGGKDESKNEPNNNFLKNESAKALHAEDGDSRSEEKLERRKKFFQHYLYQRNYQEALRSLLWEPYDCRDDCESWYYEGLDEDDSGAIVSEVPHANCPSLPESSLSLCSSCSSLDEILTVEMTQKGALLPENRYSLNIDAAKKLPETESSSESVKIEGKPMPAKTKERSKFFIESKFPDEKVEFVSGFPKFRCSSDPVQNVMNLEIMVSDLHAPTGEGFSSSSRRHGAQKSPSERICASAIQYKISCCESGDCVGVREKDVLSTVDKMVVTVEGTLEPRDSNEGTQLVSPDTSLDLNDNPVRLTGQNRAEPGPSSGNISVVNCYRAVPVSVVSTVPTIKCLNTQENVSNVQIIQTSSSPEQKIPAAKYPLAQAKRFPVRPASGPNVPSTSRVRAKVPRDVSRNQNRHSLGSEQNTIVRVPKIERERPKSMNACVSEVSSEQTGQAPSLCENPSTSTSSNNDSSVLSNHNRSISNPVLGNQTKPIPNRFGSHQNIPIRLETHFGQNGPDGTERSQIYLPQRNVPSTEAQPEREPTADQGAENLSKTSLRTFISTEAQTDDVPLGIHPQSVINREQRRRERRERRHQRRLHQSVLSSGSVWQSNVDVLHRDRRGLPDILNSHMPPPYSAVPVPAMSAMPPPLHVPPPMPVPPGPQTVPHLVDSPPGHPLPHQNGLRFLFPFPGGRR